METATVRKFQNYIRVEGTTVLVRDGSEEQGIALLGQAVYCEGCGHDLCEGPCRAHQVVCWGCGRKYDMYIRAVGTTGK